MRGLADLAGRIRGLGERDFTAEAGEALFFAPDVTPSTDRAAWCRTHRVNGDGSLRDATAAEVADYDTWLAGRRAENEAAATFDVQRAVKALSLLLLDEINIVRTNPTATLAARTEAQLRTAFIAKYRAL